jgi:hypothetical protein
MEFMAQAHQSTKPSEFDLVNAPVVLQRFEVAANPALRDCSWIARHRDDVIRVVDSRVSMVAIATASQ